jgi:hypothetical protein
MAKAIPDTLLQQAVDTVAAHNGIISDAARELKLPRQTLQSRLEIAARCGISTNQEKKETLHGWNPTHDLTKVIPAPLIIRGTSSLYGDDGALKLQWVKTQLSDAKVMEGMQAALESLAENLPKYEAVKQFKHPLQDDLLNLYVVTDFHLGALADADECGEDWDTKIAEKLFINWYKTAISLSPYSKKAVLCNLGDLMHTDGWEALTPANKNLLDVDTRFSKTIRAAIRMIRTVIKLLLEKHEELYVIMADANHDPASAAWLRELLASCYSDEPRITVDTNMDTYYCVEHGLTSIFFHHGHKRKVENVDDVFVAKYREIFGRSKFSYAHLGHLHSNQSKETNLMMVERHRTLTAPDAYSTKGGWMSGRDAKVITYSKQFGEVARLTISPDMVKHHTET